MTAIAVGSVAAVRDRVMEAANRGTALRIVGRGTWLDAGRPVAASESVSTRELSGISQYVPGDLTLTASSGTTIGEIRAATAEHGQWLALDPYGSDDGTIGATVATASAGPLFSSFGRPRDLVLGIEVIIGTGAVIRAGGRVVKNVAGFDLTRLVTGSWGSLGVITEVTVRLHAKPAAEESFAVSLDANGGVERTRTLLRRLPFVPYACEILNGALAERVIGRNGVVALVRIGGNSESVHAQRAAFTELGDVRQIDGDVWRRLRTVEPLAAMAIRFSQTPDRIADAWQQAMLLTKSSPAALVHASPVRGTVRCIAPTNPESVAALRRILDASPPVTRIGERLPADLWSRCAPPPIGDVLSSRVKHMFDPKTILNPGIFGEASPGTS